MRIVLVLSLLCEACSAPSVLVRQNASFERLGIYFEPGEQSFPIIADKFDVALNDFIWTYNSNPKHRFELFRASATDSVTLRIKLVATRMVSRVDQTAGIVVSLIGLTVPFLLISAEAPIIIFFYYFPKVRSLTELSLSEDINGSTLPPGGFILSSPGFLKVPEKQMQKHVVYFDILLERLVNQIEKQVHMESINSHGDG